MSNLTSIPVSDPKRFLSLQDEYKQSLMGDMRLEEASDLAARRQLLLENRNVPPEWALPQVKAMSRKLNRLTKRIRQPFGIAGPATTPSMFPADSDDPAEDFAAGPVQALVRRLVQPASAIKTPPTKPPVKRRADQFTPQLTPSTRKAKRKAKQQLEFRGKQTRVSKPKPKKATTYRPDLGPPIPFNPDETPKTPQGQATSQLKKTAKTAGKKAAKSAAKSAGRSALKWFGWRS